MLIDELTTSVNQIISQTDSNLHTLGIILLIPWSAYILNLLLGNRLFYLGIIPRHTIGLPGIIFAPLLHANFNHLFLTRYL